MLRAPIWRGSNARFASASRPEEEEQHTRDEGDAADRDDEARDVAEHLSRIHHTARRLARGRRSRRLLASTDTLDSDMAAAAIIGLSIVPVSG